MTCIVGFVTPSGVWVGGDSASVSGTFTILRAEGKVFRVGEFLVGSAGSVRVCQAFRYGFTPPKIRAGEDVCGYMVTRFADALRGRFRDAGCMGKDDHRDEGGTFVVAVRGRLFYLFADFQVSEPSCGYAVIGSGSEVAAGAVFAGLSLDPDVQPERLVRTALEAAEANDSGVRGPFTILRLPNKGAARGKAKTKV